MTIYKCLCGHQQSAKADLHVWTCERCGSSYEMHKAADIVGLTQAELDLCARIGAIATDFEALSAVHPADRHEFVAHVHALQNIVMSRAAVRAHPEAFNHIRTGELIQRPVTAGQNHAD